MKIVQINTFSYKAAGNIMMNLHKAMLEQGIDSYVAWGRGRKAENDHEYYMNDDIGVKVHGVYTRITDMHGFASKRATVKLLKWIDNIHPDIIHLHCIHGYYINIELLFNYIKKNNIKVVWTQHDCWAFTGHCASYDMCGCQKWKFGCYDCERLGTYPRAYTDNSMSNWNEKRKLFDLENMVLVTPSQWLANQLSQSFLRDNNIVIINNGIDLSKFKPSGKKKSNTSDYTILGVAGEWREEKGLFDFIELSQKIPNNYQILLIGTNSKVDKLLPRNIISIHRTNNQEELAQFYSSADVFVNLTKEDNFPTVNIESLACGVPVITYDTGGSPEIIDDKCGLVVEKDNVQKVAEEVVSICECNSISAIDCIKRANKYSKECMIKNYLSLYERIMD